MMKERLGLMRPALLVLMCALAFGCATGGFENKNGPPPAASEAQADSSSITTSIAPDGTKVEVRTFANGDIARVTRLTRPDGTRRVIIESRESFRADLTDPDE